nr:low temperature requirement protein A [uncultured Draconibacterium sp.]
MELFYDLVYVIAISRITYYFSHHISTEGFIEYAFLFILIFWGWLNGSLYYDLHGNEGWRTRLMTLWQMVIIAALAVVISQSLRTSYFSITIVFMIMQLYITYMWWSVGIYDKSHRRYNVPYTVLYLTSLALMALSLVINENWRILIYSLILICNYAPPFIAHRLLRYDSKEINMTSSMFERLGLFTIIVFGELVIGVVDGISKIEVPNITTWINFTLAISIVFVLWWLFFTLVGQREAKNGFLRAALLELLFVPTLLALGLVAVSFYSFFNNSNGIPIQKLGYALTAYLVCISLMIEFTEAPENVRPLKRKIQLSLLITAMVFVVLTLLHINFQKLYFLVGVLVILAFEIFYLNFIYYRNRNL